MKYRWALLIISLCLAFLLRIWGLDFGLPFAFHPDEHQYVDVALKWYEAGWFDVGFINPPLFTYVLVTVFWPWVTLSPVGLSSQWVSNAYYFARLWSVIFGILTIALAYPAGKLLRNRKTGLVALVLVAGLFLLGRESHFAVNDTAVTFFVFLAIYFCLCLYNRPRLSNYLLAGISIGLAISTKLTGGVVVLSLITAHLFVSNRNRVGFWPGLRSSNLWLSISVIIITFFIIDSHIFWRWSQFIESIMEHLQFGVQGYKGLQMSPANGWIFYGGVLGWGMGWLMLLAAIAVMGYVIWRRDPQGIIVAISPLALFFLLGAQKNLFARFILPAVPPLVVLVALGLIWLERRWSLFQQKPKILWPLLVGILIFQPLTNLIWFDHLLTLPDTRQLATDWVIGQFSEDTVIARQGYSIFPTTLFLQNTWPYKMIYLDERGPTKDNIDHYLASKANLIAVSNFIFDRRRADNLEEEARLNQLAFLEEQATLVKEFNPYRNEADSGWFYLDQLYGPAGETLIRVNPGPLIKIYRLPYESQPYSLEMPPIANPVNANFDNQLTLLGYDLPSRRSSPGGSFPLTLYWQAADRMDKTYVIFNHLLDSQQQNWGGYDRWPQETANTNLWHPGEVVVDAFSLPIAVDAPDGIYTIDIGLYDQVDPTGTPLTLFENGSPTGSNSVRIGPVKVGKTPPDLVLSSGVAPQTPMSVDLGDPPVIRLLGYDLVQEFEALQLTLYWESLAQTSYDWTIFSHLRNRANETVAQGDVLAGGGRYSSSLWDANEKIADSITIKLTPEIPPGEYSLVVGLYDLNTGVRLTVPNSVHNEIILTTVQKP
jgi:4-amino-4-deoxy-L-arabinose transferase-like glycosyltransferase